MKKIILDTNFIMTCVKEKIDFFEEIENFGAKIQVPEKVVQEMKNIKNSKQKLKARKTAELGLKILEKEAKNYELIELKTKNVDNGLKKLSEEKDVIIATLDAELKQKIKCPNLVIRAKKKLEII